MAALPFIDWTRLSDEPGCVVEAFRDPGAFYLANPPLPAELSDLVLQVARTFFALPPMEKAAVHIRHSPHFRGFSEMHNTRDWREQMHLAAELPPDVGAEYLRLQGPNLWPAALGEELRGLMEYLAATGGLGSQLLAALARGLGFPESHFQPATGEPPYLLMKLINYHPQPGGGPPRVGVAPHCDWSWVTLLLQCELGGLQVRTPGGDWQDVPPVPDTLVVNAGELLEVATGGRLRATPHRVINHSSARPRISVPVFVNPPLSEVVSPAVPRCEPVPEPEHIHRVLEPDAPFSPFVFGESEWRRKGLGRWCHRPGCVGGV